MNDKQFALLHSMMAEVLRELRISNFLATINSDQEVLERIDENFQNFEDRMTLMELEKQLQDVQTGTGVDLPDSLDATPSARKLVTAMLVGGYETFGDLLDAAVKAGYQNEKGIRVGDFVQDIINSQED